MLHSVACGPRFPRTQDPFRLDSYIGRVPPSRSRIKAYSVTPITIHHTYLVGTFNKEGNPPIPAYFLEVLLWRGSWQLTGAKGWADWGNGARRDYGARGRNRRQG